MIGTAIAGQKFDTSSILNAPLADFIVHHQATLGRPGAGPALALSLVLVAIVCAFTALCYAELASMIPIAGSAYTYTYATMGELIAWIIGWDLILEYAVSNMAVSVGFAAHLVDMFDWFGWHPALRWISPAYLPSGMADFKGNMLYAPGWHFGFNIPGVSGGHAADDGAGARHSRVGRDQQRHGHPEDRGHPGVRVRRACTSFIRRTTIPSRRTDGRAFSPAAPSFSSPISASIRFRPPPKKRRTRSAICPSASSRRWSSARCSTSAVAVVLTGIVPWQKLIDDAAPVVNSLKQLGITTGSHTLHWMRLAVLFGAMMGMISSLLVFQLGQARVWFAMSRDGLLPKLFGRVHPRFRTPSTATWIAGFLVGIPGGILDIGTLADLSNIGTLFAFVLVSLGVIILRYKQPERRRGFRAPGGLAAPILSVLFCLLLMSGLPILTWIRFFVWLVIGLSVYMLYSRYRSEFCPRGPQAVES